MAWQIQHWDRTYENAKSRTFNSCAFVCVPNQQDGDGIIHILTQPDGAAIYGIFCLIVGRLSRQPKPRGGWLTSDGTPTGTPWTAERMATWWRRKPDEILRAMEVLTSPDVAWIAIPDGYQKDTTRIPDGYHGILNGTNGMELNERNVGAAVAADPVPSDAGEDVSADESEQDRKPRKREPTGPHAELRTHFCKAWASRYGAAYPINFAKDGAHLKWVLQHSDSDIEKAKAAVDRYLSDNDAFVTRDRHGLGLLVSQFRKYAVAAPTTSGPRMSKPGDFAKQTYSPG